MKDYNNYFEKRNENNLKKIEELLLDMPVFCSEYFIGTENNTSPLTRLNYAFDLRIFFDYISRKKQIAVSDMKLNILDDITDFDIQSYLSYLSDYTYKGKREKCAERGKARKLSSVRAMYRYFFNRDKIKSNVASKVSTPKLHDKEIIRLEVNEVTDILNLADSDNAYSGRKNSYHLKTKVRDFAMLSLFLGTGIRISELIGLNVDDFDFENNSFIVTRKGGNRTILYITDEVKDALISWIDERRANKEIDSDEKALFISLQNRRIAPRSVEYLVKSYAKRVAPLKKITPHKLRSTFGTNLYNETGDIYAVADYLGHKDVNTTRKHYAAVIQDSRRDTVKNIKLR